MHVLSVSELAGYISAVVESDPVLADVWVEGEVSNWSRASSGHCYWTMRQYEANIATVCWRQSAQRQPSLPSNGEQVLVHGKVEFWPGNGRLQLYVDLIRPAGIGLLHAQLEALKQRLEAEGLFDTARKRPIPELPRSIGIVTSPTGAALRDILHVLGARWPLADVLLAPAKVQGEGSAESIVEALYDLYAVAPDVIVLARGGGSIEDLWSFNDESVARAVFASPVPLITGVGHETDTTIVDFVADLRAPTPSLAAAEASPDRAALHGELLAQLEDLHEHMLRRVAGERDELSQLAQRVQRLAPVARLARGRADLQALRERLHRGAATSSELRRLRLASVRGRLEMLSPHGTLARGYAIVRRANGAVVLDPSEVEDGAPLRLELRDGPLGATADKRILTQRRKDSKGT